LPDASLLLSTFGSAKFTFVAMLVPGLVSITFRFLSVEEIIRLVVQAGLEAIEWGGDLHVPAGDLTRARDVGRLTREAGLAVSAYGSYYRLGQIGKDTLPFEDILASAVGLRAPTIRVWAGNKGSASCTVQERHVITDDALRVAQLAAHCGITISLEYHDGTLTDTRASVQRLLTELDHPNIEFLWQPSHGESLEECANRLRDVLPRLRNVHVFHWWPTHGTRHSLAEGEARWQAYINIVRQTGRTTDMLLEFVAGDSPLQLLQDAATLKCLLAS
jgi:3-dehydroshikimate dehydratase